MDLFALFGELILELVFGMFRRAPNRSVRRWRTAAVVLLLGAIGSLVAAVHLPRLEGVLVLLSLLLGVGFVVCSFVTAVALEASRK